MSRFEDTSADRFSLLIQRRGHRSAAKGLATF